MHLGCRLQKHSENLFGGPNIFGDVVKTYEFAVHILRGMKTNT